MPENPADEPIQRWAEAMNPFGRLLEEMTETAKLWMAATAVPDKTAAEYRGELRKAAERTAQLTGAWSEPLRKLREEHTRFAEEMATWAERHRQFAEEVSRWADAHRETAERLNEWSQPVLQYAELLNDSMNAVVSGMFPPEPDGGAT